MNIAEIAGYVPQQRIPTDAVFFFEIGFEKIDFKDRFRGAPSWSMYFLMVDGTDFRIPEPVPFDRKWYSHKFKGPGLHYKVAVGIYTGLICWTNGPFPCGKWPDSVIAKNALHLMLDEGEHYVVDRGYRPCHPIVLIPTGLGRFID